MKKETSGERENLEIDGRVYGVDVHRRIGAAPDSVKIIIPAFMPNYMSMEVTRVCIESILANTEEPFELWVVDNNSPKENSDWLLGVPGVNIAFNRTTPLSPSSRHFLRRLWAGFSSRSQVKDGAYANAIGLEIGVRLIDPSTKLVFTAHSDILVLKKGWLAFLRSKISGNVRAASCWTDKIRVQALHVGGLLFDYRLYRDLEVDFFPNIKRKRTKKYPEYDVGDLITLRFKEAGFDVSGCQNTYNTPGLVDRIKPDDPIKGIHSDRCFDDEGDVFYAHMGRGIPKSLDTYNQVGKTYPQQWVEFAEQCVLPKARG